MSEQEDITQHISNGSYGKITILDECTILKSMQKFSKDNIYYKQNIQEVVFLSSIKHANIIKAKKIYLTCDEIKLELERGETTLHDYINNIDRKNRMINFKYIFFQLIKVLFFLHKNKLIHGDIKPNNILLSTTDMTIKLIDFGGICSFRLNNQHKPICTPSFCPPEGWKQLNINCLNTKFDVWSLGMTLYFFVCRKYLLDFKDDGTIHYINEFKWSFDKNYHHCIDSIKNIIDPYGFKLLEKMLMYDPDDRISTDELYYDNYFSEYNIETIPKISFESEFDTSFVNSNYNFSDWKKREFLVNFTYNLCTSFEIMDHFVLTMWIIDKYVNKNKKKITTINAKLLSCSGIVICSILLGNKSFDCNDFIIYLPKHSYNKFQDSIDNIMLSNDFKLYVPTFDYILKNKKNIIINYKLVRNIINNRRLIGMDQHSLADIYLNY